MDQRRILINVRPTGWLGWLGWLVVTLLAVPLLMLSFFFVAAAVMLTAVIVAWAAARFYWLRRTARKREPIVDWNEGRQRSGDIIDIEPADRNEGNAVPLTTESPRLR